jgi:Ni/Co efflux regulator RcnB
VKRKLKILVLSFFAALVFAPQQQASAAQSVKQTSYKTGQAHNNNQASSHDRHHHRHRNRRHHRHHKTAA